MTNFPTSLDDATSIPVESAGTALATNHVTSHQNVQDAIEAIEAKVGIDGSAVTTSHDYKLSGVTGTDKAVSKTGTETLTNKTLTTPTINTPTINTPKIAIGSDAVGDIHYTSNIDGTQSRLGVGADGKILKLVSGLPSWETENAAVNASTTVKGVVEAATASEVTAGTATGGTGAVLAVTPDALAASTPVFNGSGLTNVAKVSLLAGYTSSGDTNENTVYSTTINANTIGTNGIIIARTPISYASTASAETFTIKLKFGGSTLHTHTFAVGATGGGTACSGNGVIEFIIKNNSSASSQQHSGNYVGGTNLPNASNTATNTYSRDADGTSSIDTTSNQTLTVTVQRATGSGGSTLVFYYTTLITIKQS